MQFRLSSILFFLFFLSLSIHSNLSAQTWESLLDSSDYYFDTDQKRSLMYLQDAYNALSTQNAGKPNSQEAVLLNNLGMLYWDVDDLGNSKKYLLKSVETWRNLGQTSNEDYANALTNAANVSKILGDFGASERLYKELVEVIGTAKGNRSTDYIKSIQELGGFYEHIGELEMAAANFEKAHTLLEQNHSTVMFLMANSYSDLGRIYIKLGQPDKAFSFIQHSDELYEANSLTHKLEYLENLEHLGIVYEYLGKYGESERVLLKTLDLKKKREGIDEGLILETLNDLGILYIDLGNYEKAGGHLQEAFVLSKKIFGPRHPNYATAANNLASYYNDRGDLDKAFELFRESADIYKANYGEYYPKYATSLNNMAGIRRTQKKYDEAKKYYEDALRIDKVVLGENHPDYATLINNMAVLYSNTGDHQRAEALYLQALNLRKVSLGENHPSYARSLENLGLYYITHDQPKKSGEFFKEAIKIQVGQVAKIFPALSEIEREVFYNTVREDVERFNTIALKLMKESPAILGDLYDNQLATKSIIFYASDKVRKNVLASGDEQLIQDFILWKTLKARLAKFYQVGTAKLKEMNINIDELEVNINNLEKKLAYESSYFKSGEDKVYSWVDIRRNLKEGEAAVEIVRFREFKSLYGDDDNLIYGFSDHIQYAALIIKSDSYTNPELVLLNNGNQLEKQYYSAFFNSLKFGVTDNETYVQFWAKIQEHLGGVKKIYFSPDGVYNKFNPETLYIPDQKKYLADLLDVNFVTSTKDVVEFSRTEKNNEKTAVLIGNPDYGQIPSELATNSKTAFINMFQPLPGTMVEIHTIDDMLRDSGWNSKISTDRLASEERIKVLVSPKILHISTHGYFLENPPFISQNVNTTDTNPLFKSGLVLADANNFFVDYVTGKDADLESEDGILTAYEAMNLTLDNTDLVVLSACETGLGEVMNGEGVYGLQRALKVAGARNLILSLNKVDDQVTKDLMISFYKYYLSSGTIRESFRKAQMDVRSKYENPYFWGSFILIGKG
jgi:CHAT domain-containing protein/tetratricopeptide (TPR) repeat protein